MLHYFGFDSMLITLKEILNKPDKFGHKLFMTKVNLNKDEKRTYGEIILIKYNKNGSEQNMKLDVENISFLVELLQETEKQLNKMKEKLEGM